MKYIANPVEVDAFKSCVLCCHVWHTPKTGIGSLEFLRAKEMRDCVLLNEGIRTHLFAANISMLRSLRKLPQCWKRSRGLLASAKYILQIERMAHLFSLGTAHAPRLAFS